MRNAVYGALLLSMSFGVSAAEYRCDNCSEAQYEAKVTATLVPLGEHHVYDLAKGEARKYQTYNVLTDDCPDGRKQCYAKAATRLPVEPDVDLVVDEVTAFLYAISSLNQGSVDTKSEQGALFEVRADGSINHLTVFDVAGPGGPQNSVASWVRGNPSIQNILPFAGAGFHSAVTAAVSILKNSVGLTRITIVLSDGGRITVTWNLVNGTVEIDQDSVVDALNNIVPADPSELEGLRFDYRRNPNGAEERAMRGYLSSPYMGGNVIPPGPKWACTSAGGGPMKCSAF